MLGTVNDGKRIDVIKFMKRQLGDKYTPQKENELYDISSFIIDNKSKDSFRTTLFGMIDKKGIKDVEVYKKAGIARNVFSYIKREGSHQVTRKTAYKIALGLELDEEETIQLISSAGYVINYSNTFDLIILYHIRKQIFDVIEINKVLIDFNSDIL